MALCVDKQWVSTPQPSNKVQRSSSAVGDNCFAAKVCLARCFSCKRELQATPHEQPPHIVLPFHLIYRYGIYFCELESPLPYASAPVPNQGNRRVMVGFI